MTQGFDDLDREEIVDVLGTALDIRDALVKLATPRSSPEYVSSTITVVEGGQPIRLLGGDLARVRALVRASTDGIYIGSYSQLAGTEPGYPLPVSSGDEIKTTDEVYVSFKLNPPTGVTAYVAVWVERAP